MWLFGVGRKQDSSTSQPVQRQICIRTRDGIDEQGEPVTLSGGPMTTGSNGHVTTTTTTSTTSRFASSFRQSLNNSFSGLFRGGDTSSAGGRRGTGTSSFVGDDESEVDGNVNGRNVNGGGDEDDDNQEEEDNSDSDSKSTSSSLSGTKYSGGNRGGNNGRSANRSYLSFNREPLDVRTWSNVTSPGFTSRVVQQANGNGIEDVASHNLRTFTGGNPIISRASLARSPNLSLRLGQLPISTSPKRRTSAMINFPSPNRSSFSYNRFSRVHKRDMNGPGTIFVKLAPVDLKSLPVAPIQNSGIYPNNNSYDQQQQQQQQQHSSHGPSRAGNSGGMGIRAGGGSGSPSTPTSPGLGGSPLAQRFGRLGWRNKYPGPQSTGYIPMSPTNSNILDNYNRKRGRDLDTSVNSSQTTDLINRVGPSNSTPKSSLTSPEDQKKFIKRVKYVTEQDIRHHSNRPLNYDAYHDSPSGSDPMTSKSILEQMNQTEKRFFPDVSPITSAAKRTKLSSIPTSGIRKRKVMGENGISIVELEDDEVAQDPKSKTGKFCHCNECYAEAAGISMLNNNNSLVASPPRPSPTLLPKKTVTFEASTSSKMNTSSSCDKGTGTDMEMTTPEIIIRMATQHTLITKEKYDYDRIKRIERFKRILGLEPTKPPAENDQKPVEQQSVDVMDGNKNKTAPPPTIEVIPPTPATSTFALPQPKVTEVTNALTSTTSSNDSAPSSTNANVSEAPKVTFGAVNIIPASNSVVETSTDVKPIQFTQPKVETTTTELPIKTEGTQGFNFGSPATTTTAASQQSTIPTFSSSAPTSAITFGGFSSTPTATTTSAPAPTFGGFSSPATTTSAPPAYGSTTTTAVFGSGTGSGFGVAAAPTTTTTASSGFGSTNAVPILTFGNNNQIQTTSAAPAATTTTSGFNFGQSTTTTTTTSAPSSSIFSLGGGGQTSAAPSNIFGSLTPASTSSNNISGFGSSTQSVPTFGLSASTTPFGGVTSTTTAAPTFGSSAATTGFGAVAPQAAATPFQFGQAQSQPAPSTGFNFGSTGAQQPGTFQFGSTPQTSDQQPADGAAGIKIVPLPKLELIAPTPTTSTSAFSFSQPQVSSTTVSSTNNNELASLTNGAPKITFGATSGFPTFGSVSGTTADSSEAKPFQFQAKPDAATTEQPIKNGIMGGFNFGSQTTTTAAPQFTTPSIFGSTPAATNNNAPTFGGFSSAAPTTSAPPTFGSTTPMFGSGGGSIFGSTAPTASINPSSSVFGSNNNTSTSAFGASTNAPPLFAFGNNNQIQTTSAPTTGGFNFGQSATTTTTSAPSSSIFSLGGQQHNNNTPSNIFGNLTPSSTNSTTNNNSISAFGSSTPAFGLSAASSPISQPFGSGGNMTSPTPTFGSPAAANSSFGFGAAPQAPQAAAPFQFGQTQSQPASNGGFNFGSVAGTAGTQQPPVFQFGGAPQTAGAGLAGGFNFASQAASTTPMGAPSPGGNMFSLGQATAQPRRRPVQRRYR